MIALIKIMKVKVYVGTDKGEINFEPLKDERYMCANPLQVCWFLKDCALFSP